MSEQVKIGNEEAVPTWKFYRAVWRWHFYAGLFVIPFLVILAVTGIIYLFKPQLDALMYRDVMFVVPSASAVATPDMQLTAVRSAFPESKVLKYRTNWEADRSSEFDILAADGRDLKVFVDPYQTRVLGYLDNKNNLQYYAFEIHGKLMAGRPGEWIIELAVCWALVLLISGLYMWLPRKGSKVWGILLPRLRSQDKRIFWRDLHAVIGLYGAVIVAFMIFTGLPWTDLWGKQIVQPRSYYPAAGKPKPESEVLLESLNATGGKTIPWAVENSPIPESDEHAGHDQHENKVAGNATKNSRQNIGLTKALEIAVANNAPPDSLIALPMDAKAVYSVTAFPNDPRQQTTIHIDQYSGKILGDIRWNSYGILPKAVEMGIALHEGKFFGLPNQLLMLFAAMTVLILALSGVIMWWQRRPAKRLGAPPMPEDFPLWKGAVGVIALMGVIFPLVGASLVVVLLLDYLIFSRMPKLKRILS